MEDFSSAICKPRLQWYLHVAGKIRLDTEGMLNVVLKSVAMELCSPA
jgi:hypothetical protein